ncbi:hypothetical protein D3C75_846110 [compost metagenome]
MDRVLFGGDGILFCNHHTFTRSAIGVSGNHRVNLSHRIVLSIHIHIQPEVVDMLMCCPYNVMIDQCAIACIFRSIFVMHRGGLNCFNGFYSRCSNINFDYTVWLKHPIKNIIVIPDGTDPPDY